MFRRRLHALLLAAALTGALAAPACALEIWSGRTLSFSKPAFADWTQPGNQDRITDVVWLTRADTRGIFNIQSEIAYGASSPAGTEWATGNAVDHASLSFLPWRDWAIGNPPATVGVDAVVHLVAEDIYVDIRFDSWAQTGLGGGEFSYTRAERPTTSVGPGRTAFALRGFLANPAGAGTPLEFSLPDGAPARLEVFDLAGRLVARRDVGALGAGVHRVDLAELRSQPAGLLFVRLVREGRSLVSRATRLR